MLRPITCEYCTLVSSTNIVYRHAEVGKEIIIISKDVRANSQMLLGGVSGRLRTVVCLSTPQAHVQDGAPTPINIISEARCKMIHGQ